MKLKKSENLLKKFNKKKKSNGNPIFNFLIKFFALIYSRMLKVSTKDIKIFDAINDETYLKNKAEYTNYDEYYDAQDFVYTLVPKGDGGYSLSHIGKEFFNIYKKKSLLIIVEETEAYYDFLFVYTGEVYNKNNLGSLRLEKNSYIDIDKRLEFALIYYLFVIEHKEIYIISNNKLDFFNGFDQYITYIPRKEIYNIMLRIKYLSKINSKIIQVIVSLAIIIGTGFGGNEAYIFFDKKLQNESAQEVSKIQSKIAYQSEITETQKQQADILRYYEESPKVLKND